MKSKNLSEILHDKSIIIFNDTISINKNIDYNNVKIKILLKISDHLTKEFLIYRNDPMKPLFSINNTEEIKKNYINIQGLTSQEKKKEILLIKNMIDELNNKQITFFVPHTYYIKQPNDKNAYFIDLSCKDKRVKQLKKFLKNNENKITILASHHHPDHIGNNGKIADKNIDIYHHPRAKDIIGNGFWKFFYQYNKVVFQNLDMARVLKRLFHLSYIKSKILSFIIHYLFPLANLFIILLSMQNIGFVRIGAKKIKYFPDNAKKKFNFKNIKFEGWMIDENFYALEAPGHTSDHLLFYIKNIKTLFIGDMDRFLNPAGNVTDGSINLINDNIIKIIKFVKYEKIECLLAAHSFPVIGNSNIQKYLKEYKKKIDYFNNTILQIVLKKDVWEWEDLMETIFKDDKQIIKDALNINWPKTPSNIDMYMLLFLKENNFHCIDNKRKIWEKFHIN